MSAADRLKEAGPQIAALAAHIRALAGDDDQAVADTLDGETDAVEAARRVVREIAEAEAMMSALSMLVIDYRTRAERFKARRERLRGALARFMDDIGQKTLPLPEATLSLTTGQKQLVGDADPEYLADALCNIKRSVDRAKVKAALENGFTVEGFSLDNAPPHVTIRRK